MILIIIGLLLYYQFLYKPDFFSHIIHLARKLFFPKQYEIPNTNVYDYPLPPFPNAWYPICMSKDIPPGTKKPITFANQEIIVFRGNSRKIQVIPKYCQHMGVDLTHGCVKENTIECPMHGKQIKNGAEVTFHVEEHLGMIFIWNGEANSTPNQCLKEQFEKFNMEKDDLVFPMSMGRWVGGHIIDYNEHLLDVHHAPYIHKASLHLGERGIQYDDIHLVVHLDVENTDYHPKFHYITPYFGFIEYVNNARVYIYFFQEKVGKMKMVILPCWNAKNGILGFLLSIMFSVYTYIDFSDEAAYFSTKKHKRRNLKACEKIMNDFRKQFTEKFFTQKQQTDFNNKQYNVNLDW